MAHNLYNGTFLSPLIFYLHFNMFHKDNAASFILPLFPRISKHIPTGMTILFHRVFLKE